MYLYFVLTLINVIKEKKWTVILFSIPNLIFIWLNFNSSLYTHLTPRFGLGFWPEPTIYFHFYLLYWHWTCLYGFYWLIKGWRSSTSLRREQIKFVTLACGIGYLGGATNWPMWYKIEIPPYANIAISLYVALIAYAILRHRLMDFNLIMRWGMAYALLFLTLGLAMVPLTAFLEYVLHERLRLTQGLATVFVVCVGVFIFGPLRRAITRFVDRFIFRSPDFQSILAGIEQTIKGSNNIDALTRQLSEKLKMIWGAGHAGLVVWDYILGRYKLMPEEAFKDQAVVRNKESISPSDFLIRTLESEKRLFKHGVITEEELNVLGDRALPGEKTTFWKIRRTMRWLGANACVPLLAKDQLSGFIVLGTKKNGASYNEEDKKFLSHVAQIVAGALQKTLTEEEKGWGQNPVSQLS